MRFFDLHQHVLWGLDDGAKSFLQTCAMLRIACEEGITAIAATPHVQPGIQPFDLAKYHNHLQEARDFCNKSGFPITLLEGAEIWFTPFTLHQLEAGRIPTIGGTNQVLVELSPKAEYRDLLAAYDALWRNGFQCIFSHVERYRCFLKNPTLALHLREQADVQYQVNANSITHPTSFFQRRLLREIFRTDSVDFVASDAHDDVLRPPRLQEAFLIISHRYGEDRARKLFSRGEAYA